MHYVKWSWLSSMASIMWVALIAHDWYLGNKIEIDTEFKDTIELSKEQMLELETSPKMVAETTSTAPDGGGTKEEIIQSNPDIFKQFTLSNFNIPPLTSEILHETSTSWIARFWNIVAFIMSVASCILIRAALNYLLSLFWKTRVSCISSVTPAISTCELKTPVIINKSVTRIPTLQTKKSDYHLGDKYPKDPAECINIISNEINRELIEYKQRLTNQEEINRSLAKDFETLKEEKNSEIENLNRRLETITVQKKELSKQLVATQKENRITEANLHDLQQEKDDLNKRIVNLLREYRFLQKTKRVQTRQLENLKNENDSLKRTNDKLLREKHELNRRISKLETDVDRLKTVNKNDIIQGDKFVSSSEPIHISEKPEKLCESVVESKKHNVSWQLQENVDSKLKREHSYDKNVSMWINGQALNMQKTSSETVNIQDDGSLEITEVFHSCLEYSTGSVSNYVTSQSSSRLHNCDDAITYFSSTTSVSLTETTDQNKPDISTDIIDTDLNEFSENTEEDFDEFWNNLQISSSNLEIPDTEHILQKYCTEPEAKFLCDFLQNQKKGEINKSEHKNCFDGEVTRLAVCRDVSSRNTPRLSYPGESIPLEQAKHGDSSAAANNNSSSVVWSQRFLSDSPVFKHFLQNLKVSAPNENESNKVITLKKEKPLPKISIAGKPVGSLDFDHLD